MSLQVYKWTSQKIQIACFNFKQEQQFPSNMRLISKCLDPCMSLRPMKSDRCIKEINDSHENPMNSCLLELSRFLWWYALRRLPCFDFGVLVLCFTSSPKLCIAASSSISLPPPSFVCHDNVYMAWGWIKHATGIKCANFQQHDGMPWQVCFLYQSYESQKTYHNLNALLLCKKSYLNIYGFTFLLWVSWNHFRST